MQLYFMLKSDNHAGDIRSIKVINLSGIQPEAMGGSRLMIMNPHWTESR